MRRLLLALSLIVATLLAVVAPAPAQAAPAATTGFRWHPITASDGVVLRSNVIAPARAGRYPAVVLVASWGLNDLQYLAQAKQLAEQGYVVLSYTARGFWLSGGTIDVGGPKDIADASTAVDWLLANTDADPQRIGFVGMSYGGGIGLLAAASDSRIRAVGSLSGWADLAAAMYAEQTRRPQAAWFLQTAAELVGRPSPELADTLAAYWANRDHEDRERWARGRSPRYAVEALNRNRPAILLAHSYGDSIFPVNQVVDFYGSLSTPKRLEIAPGDHALVELSGLAGLPNQVWRSVRRWLDHHLRGVDTGIADEPGVVLRPHNTAAVEHYADWARVSRRTERHLLDQPRGLLRTGSLGAAAPAAWTTGVRTGVDTPATAGVALLTNGFTALTGIPPMVWLPGISRRDAAVWVSKPAPAGGSRLRGTPRLRLPVGSAGPTGTVVGYLYDVDAVGNGRLFSHAPSTWLHGPTTVDLALQATAYDLPAGHRLALVVDTRDPLYLDANGAGSTVTLAGPAWLDVPLG